MGVLTLVTRLPLLVRGICCSFFPMGDSTGSSPQLSDVRPQMGDPQRTHGHSGSLKITTVPLDGTNYLEWSRAAQHVIRSHQLFGYIDGTVKEPPKTDVTWKRWDSENSLVVSWLLHSMSPKVYRSYMLLDSAYDIWTRAKDTYSQVGSSTQVYELTRRILELRQGSLSVSAYFSEFERLYQELDFFEQFSASCTEDAVKLQEKENRYRLHVFLMGLNMESDTVRTHILHRSPLPSLREAFSMVLGDDDRRRTLSVSMPTTDRSAFASVGSTSRGSSGNSGHIPTCDHCGRRGHSRDSCYKLHPHLIPPGSTRGRGRGRASGRGGARPSGTRFQDAAYSTEFQEDHQGQPSSHLTTSELDALRRLLQSQSGPFQSETSTSFATATMPAAHSAATSSSEWIIDSGATDHMTGSPTGTGYEAVHWQW